jgi:transposase
MRKSFNSLSGVIRRAMNLDPLSGYLFVFKNRRADRIKAVYWDSDGMAMWYKVLQRGTFRFPDLKNFSSAGLEIDRSTLRLILDGIDLGTIRRQHRYKVQANDLLKAPTPSAGVLNSDIQERPEETFATA